MRKLIISTIAAASIMTAASAAQAVAGGGNSVGFTISGVTIGIDWSVDDSGTLRQKFGFIASQERTWQARNGGCSGVLLGPVPFLGPLPAKAWTAACSSGVRCQGGRQLMKIESSLWWEAVVGGRQEAGRVIDDTVDLGSC
jgi:hypothetical protein